MSSKKSNRRSLSSLIKQYQEDDIISTIEREYTKQSVELVPLDRVKFNPISRNQFFYDKRLKDLTESIKKNGVVSPILVRERDGIYEVVSGYKRFYVAKKLHLNEIPVTVREISDDLLIYMVLSRGHKKLHDNILNKTYSYRILINDYHVSRKDIAIVAKCSVSQVNNILRLENLDEEVKIALKKEKISYGQARVLLGLYHQQQIEYLNKMLEGQISVRQLEKEVKKLRNPTSYQEDIEQIEKRFNCNVIQTHTHLTFEFNDENELEDFVKKLNRQ
jgi:ParB family chromosome partitioning protein